MRSLLLLAVVTVGAHTATLAQEQGQQQPPAPPPTQAQAQAPAPAYTYAEAGLLRIDPDNAGSDTGWFVGGSLALGKFQVFAEYGDPGDFELWFVGGGWHGLLGRRADLVAQGAFVDSDFADGFRVEAGIRWMVLKRLEIAGFLAHTDLDLSDTNAFRVLGIWTFANRLGVGASFEFGDDGNTSRAFVRFKIGKH